MKLIDLLVQELPNRGGWPEYAKYCWQDYDKEVRPQANGFGFYVDQLAENHRQYDEENPKPGDINCVTREQYEAALAASQQPAWSGEGLPPVGTICEALAPVGKGEMWSWQRVKVVESGIDGAEKECLVYNLETTMPSWVDEFRSIRTEAELRREAAIKEMMDCSAVLVEATAGLIYDAVAAGEIKAFKLAD